MTMEFTKKEFMNLYRAVKILENGEGLLGIDIDRDVVDGLVLKLKEKLPEKAVHGVDQEIDVLIREAGAALEDCNDYVPEYDFDREFGPSYPTKETMKVLNNAIADGRCVEIDYYSLSREKFTKRKVKPENIERKSGRTYFNAFCHLRNDDRVFRVDRIKRIEVCD